MNEKDFVHHLVNKINHDPILMKWYEANLMRTGFENTTEKIAEAVSAGRLTLMQAIDLGLFIGFSTSLKWQK